MGEFLYKYLDVNGGLMMLKYHNLQFTNATKFNDPFDCHPALFDYSNVPERKRKWPGADFVSMKEELDMENLRKSTWICCLSKVYDSLLMWSYYNSHKGVCIGLNLDAVLKCCNYKFFGILFPFAEEVQYRDIHQKPDYFKDHPSWIDLLTTKSKEWEHEKEVRIITKNPAWVNAGSDFPKEFEKDSVVDGLEERFYPEMSRDCFESVFLGVNILPRNKTIIINAAWKLNPTIKVYQMTLDTSAFKLKAELLDS